MLFPHMNILKRKIREERHFCVRQGRSIDLLWFLSLYIGLCATLLPAKAQDAPAGSTQIQTAALDHEIRQFIDEQLTAHVQDIPTLSPPPRRVAGALTIGEFSWGTFMRTLAAYSQLSGSQTIAGRNIPAMIGQIGLIEASPMEKAWAQLYAALSLQAFGADLSHNAVWLSLSEQDKAVWKSILDPGRFYDRKTKMVIHLPQNYLGVAARIAAIDYQLGIITDRSYVDEILNRAAQQFTDGELFADDDLPNGRYDRYSLEYARYVYVAAQLSGRKDVAHAVEPTLKAQTRLWWDLMSADGYGYSWGRSLGDISYMDTMEIVSFLLQYPQFQPAPAQDLATAYALAWHSLRSDFDDKTHLLRIFEFGRGEYSYINKDREWQQTTGFLGKLASAELAFSALMQEAKVSSFPATLHLPEISRFQYFTQHSDRQFGVWIVHKGHLQFALPIVTGPRSATSDYLPAPQGLTGFGIPVEKIYPCLVPFLELEDHTVISAADGADEIQPSPDGQSITAIWKKWVTSGGRSGVFVDPGITATVTWRIEGDHLFRSETLTASKTVHVSRWWVAMPSTANDVITGSEKNSAETDVYRFHVHDDVLTFRLRHSDWPIETEIIATGDSALGKGAHGPIPLLLVLSSSGLSLEASQSKQWEVELSLSAK